MDVVMLNLTRRQSDSRMRRANLQMYTFHNNSESFTPYWSHSSKAVRIMQKVYREWNVFCFLYNFCSKHFSELCQRCRQKHMWVFKYRVCYRHYKKLKVPLISVKLRNIIYHKNPIIGSRVVSSVHKWTNTAILIGTLQG